MIRVLIVDDEARLVRAVKEHLTEEKMEVMTASSGGEAFSLLRREAVDVVILDVGLPDMNGLDLLAGLKKMEPSPEVVIYTGSPSVADAIRSMKLGACDYLIKPSRLTDLSKAIAKASAAMARRPAPVTEERFAGIEERNDFIGAGDEMAKVKRLISLVAPSRAPVVILGETGTGKELAAMAIHDQSPRAGHPFVTINSSALQESILESDLFGHRRGAFTGAEHDKPGLLETADGGTFFIDEVGDMSPAIQAKLLRALETGTFRKLGDTRETRVDVRFIFATNKDLKEEIREGRFRSDLYFRIGTLTISLPPLRERREDIPLLVGYFLSRFSSKGGVKHLSREALEALMGYHWPGNVRELVNVIKRSLLMSGSREDIIIDDLGDAVVNRFSPRNDPGGHTLGRRVLNLAKMEERHIRQVLSSVKGNKTKAARILGISRTSLYEKLGTIGAGG